MNRRQKIIVSVTGIFIILLALVGLTYAYFVTQIEGNTNNESISVTTADLKLVYGDGDGILVAENIIPGQTIDTKTFTVYNDGNATVSNYNVYLENVVNTFTNESDVVYTLKCETDDETNSPCTNEITTETEYPSVNGVLLTNTLAVGDTHTYTLTIKYIETNTDQSIDMGKTIGGKINIYDSKSLNSLTMEYYLMNDSRIKKNTTAPTFTGVATEEEGMYSAEDDYGDSWYFRGAQPNNYVSFAGFIWRIVRINGDGSVRLILDGTLDKVKREGETSVAGTESSFNPHFDNAYVGYMYGLAGTTTDSNRCLTYDTTSSTTVDSTSTYSTQTDCESNGGKWTITAYEATHANVGSSTIKTQLDSFYEKYLNTYNEYISDTIFCGDKSLASSTIGYNNTALGYAKNITYYAATERLYYSTGTTVLSTATPTLKCAEGEDNSYSRYTVSEQTINGVNTNGDLKYPIALLSADELVMAGAWGGFGTRTNESYYLYDSYANSLSASYWWTMSPYYFSGSSAFEFNSNVSGSLSHNDGIVVRSGNGSRPVINLRANLLIESGDGTSESPYTVKLG